MFPMDDLPPPEPESLAGFLIRDIENPDGIASPALSGELVARAARRFGITRQAVNQHLRKLVGQGILQATGSTKARRYSLVHKEDTRIFERGDGPSEYDVWAEYLAPKLRPLTNAFEIGQFAFTEIYNNALDHSDAQLVLVKLKLSPATVRIDVFDDGVGIFTRLKEMYRYVDEQAAVLDLIQGKITTAPDKHTGWGIFYTSRMCDRFSIASGHTYFTHSPRIDAESDWVMDVADLTVGTRVIMEIDTRTPQTRNAVFQEFAVPGSIGLNVTHVPLKLAEVGQDRLISRSQAKMIAARFDWFQAVVLDFKGVEEIGQAFADELFRVWQRDHPSITLTPANANQSILNLIAAARTTLDAEMTGDTPIHPNLRAQ